MDIAVDMAAPAVEWAPVARTMMEQLSAPEQAAVQAAIARLAQDFDASGVTEIRPARPGQQPFFVLRATPALRVFFVRTAGCLRVLDVVGAEQKDILPFVRRARHLAAAFGFANRALGAPDLLAIERPLFGSFRCDVAVGSAAARQFTLVELEDASETSVF